MVHPSVFPRRRRLLALIALAGCLLALCFLFPSHAAADAPTPLDADPGKCVLCHQAEVQDWSHSPHAGAMSAMGHADMTCEEGSDCSACLTCHTTNFDAATAGAGSTGVTCEACHGPYVEGHPENGQMALSVDSSVCNNCHTDTFKDWQGTPHAQAGVQCISCHRSHTQNLRLDDQALCKSCHREELQDSGHIAHLKTGVDCINCHTSPATTVSNTTGPSSPSHRFAVNTKVCTDCHGKTFHGQAATQGLSDSQSTALAVIEAPPVNSASGITEQAARVRVTKSAVTGFGLGLGAGIMGGVIFMLVIAVLVQRPWRAKS